MKRIQRLAIERPISTLMFYLGVVMLGLVAFKKLEVNLMLSCSQSS
jgi:multidrug efflux pump subunit AcrB